ncbi:hypothetical protein PHMEG_00031114 [Phytophthora megakarya]|uniref:BZIP domain-containing protein n=1 Tax=Phytophthora megakarya TaxID=4795 RepID=A0A225UYS0_9STRA|nr:hypothetical protein PHMEG_00031114 [Phytophthora megakarya]
MSSEQFPELEDTQELLQDVLAFIDENTCTDATTTSLSVGNHPKKRRSRVYSSDYERSRREKKKMERESLQNQIKQYETQLELLRLQKPSQKTSSKWGWVGAVTEEEEKRRKVEEVNYQLRGLLIQQLHAAQILGGLVMQQATLAQVQYYTESIL